MRIISIYHLNNEKLENKMDIKIRQKNKLLVSILWTFFIIYKYYYFYLSYQFNKFCLIMGHLDVFLAFIIIIMTFYCLVFSKKIQQWLMVLLQHAFIFRRYCFPFYKTFLKKSLLKLLHKRLSPFWFCELRIVSFFRYRMRFQMALLGFNLALNEPRIVF